MTLITKKGEKSKPMNYKSEKIKPLGMKNLLKRPPIRVKKKSHLKWSPISGGKKKSFEMTPH